MPLYGSKLFLVSSDLQGTPESYLVKFMDSLKDLTFLFKLLKFSQIFGLKRFLLL